MKTYQEKKEDTRREKFLIGTNPSYINAQIGGCPHASTLMAESGYFGWPIIIALPCKRWGCSHCGKIRVAQLANNVAQAEPNRFITFTTDAKLWENGRAAFDGVRRKLPDVTKAIRKKVKSFEYVRILELHKNGMPHWHLLAKCPYIPQSLLSDIWARYTGSVIVDVRAVDKYFNAVQYVVKYMAKVKYIQWTNRRISWSKNFFPPREETDSEDWLLTSKRHEKMPPHQAMQEFFFCQTARRCGNYAWTLRPYMKSS